MYACLYIRVCFPHYTAHNYATVNQSKLTNGAWVMESMTTNESKHFYFRKKLKFRNEHQQTRLYPGRRTIVDPRPQQWIGAHIPTQPYTGIRIHTYID